MTGPDELEPDEVLPVFGDTEDDDAVDASDEESPDP